MTTPLSWLGQTRANLLRIHELHGDFMGPEDQAALSRICEMLAELEDADRIAAGWPEIDSLPGYYPPCSFCGQPRAAHGALDHQWRWNSPSTTVALTDEVDS